MLNTLKSHAIPVLHATRVSMLALPCRSCFHALVKNPRPSQNTTGVERAKRMYFIHGTSMNSIPSTMSGTARTIAATVFRFSSR